MQMAESLRYLLEARNLSISFGRHFALDSISFGIRSGEVLGITGPNGSGKTTLINLISGVLRPEDGEIFFKGAAITRLKPHQRVRRGMARTFQKTRNIPDLSAYQHVLLAALNRPTVKRRRAPEQVLENRIAQVLMRTRLFKQRDVPAGRLSSGCLRRLEIARALATVPELLILDEPFAALSAREEKDLLELLQSLKAEGLTMMIVSHRFDILAALADRVLIMRDGREAFIGPASLALRHLEAQPAAHG